MLFKERKNFIFHLSCVLALGGLLSGCARNISPGVYSSRHVGESSRTEEAVVVSMRVVEVKDHEKMDQNGLGLMGGALGGGLLGSLFGKGAGQVGMVGVGALAGAAGGALLEDKLTTQQGIEYTVKVSNGTMRTVVQGPEPVLKVGEKVYLMTSHRGRSRLVSM